MARLTARKEAEGAAVTDIVRMSRTELRRDLLPSDPNTRRVRARLNCRLLGRECDEHDFWEPRGWRFVDANILPATSNVRPEPTLWQRLRACVGL